MMGKAHKELAQFMIATAQDPASNGEGQLIKVRGGAGSAVRELNVRTHARRPSRSGRSSL